MSSLARRTILAASIAIAVPVHDAHAQGDGSLTACTSQRSGDVEIASIAYRSDGLRIAGYILSPVRVDRKLPAMIYNRGGNRHFGAVGNRILSFLEEFARSGYVVLASQYRGGPGSEGRDERGGADVNDVLNIVKLASSLDRVDGGRLFMYGQSRGGMMTYIALRGRRDIRAAVVAAGVSDVRMSLRDRPDLRPLIRRLSGVDERSLRARSAVDWADEIDVPLLLMHGDLDRKVSIEQSRTMAAKLKSAGKRVKLEVFPGENHGFTRSRDEVRRSAIEWFEEHDRAPATGSPLRAAGSICAGLTGSGPVTPDQVAQATISGDADELGKLIARGADVNAPISFSHPRFARGRTLSYPPLMAAAIYGSTEVASRLLQNGANVSGRMRTAICAAVVFGHVEIVHLLLQAGLDVRGYSRCGRGRNASPLERAERLGHDEIARMLREAGAE